MSIILISQYILVGTDWSIKRYFRLNTSQVESRVLSHRLEVLNGEVSIMILLQIKVALVCTWNQFFRSHKKFIVQSQSRKVFTNATEKMIASYLSSLRRCLCNITSEVCYTSKMGHNTGGVYDTLRGIVDPRLQGYRTGGKSMYTFILYRIIFTGYNYWKCEMSCKSATVSWLYWAFFLQ